MRKSSKSKALAFLAWCEDMVRCYQEQLSEEEIQALHEWEADPHFPEIGDWPGWAPHIGLCPTSKSLPPVLVRDRRRA